VAPILAVAVAGTLQATPPEYSLSIWHGFNLPLFMSMLALALGVGVYMIRERLYKLHDQILGRVDARIGYNALLNATLTLSLSVTRRFDKGSLQHAAVWIIGASLVAGIIGFMTVDAPLFGDRAALPIDAVTLTAAIVLIAATIMTVVIHQQRFLSLISIGVVGLIIALGFVKFSAPDLALTQLSVEIVTIVLLLLALYFLPQTSPKEIGKLRLGRDAVIAVISGVGVTLLTLAVLTRDFAPISDFFIENAKPGGGGTNVVNVILVDFRGIDTLGEIVVLALAGLGIYAMLEGMKLPAADKDAKGRFWNPDAHPAIMQTLTRLLLPLMLLVAVFIFLRGHNLPGGGFIAGLIASVALIVQYLANGIDWTSERMKVDMHTVIAYGLLIGTGTGLVSIAIGFPFLTSTFEYLTWPVVGKFEVASAIAFDIGVFLVVVGATVLSLVQLGKLSRASHGYVPQQEKN
jgi:multicomponent K+:H+ antiporter subunit A